MKLVQWIKKGGFLLLLLLVCLALDTALAASGWVQSSGYFWLDDFEITRRHHPEEVWDKVIFGSSELVSGYREDLTSAHYVNLGMDYGTILDLEQMLEGGHITVGSELVIAANWSVFCGTLDTNPTYVWHRAWYEPYCYFQRDRLAGLITDDFRALLGGGERRGRKFLTQDKAFYHGHMSQQELQERVATLNEKFFSGGMADYEYNLAALERVFAFCQREGIRVRVLWMPENPAALLGADNDAVRARAAEICATCGVPFSDMTDALTADAFYDTGHMDYETGAVTFTEVLDQWLNG